MADMMMTGIAATTERIAGKIVNTRDMVITIVITVVMETEIAQMRFI
jgi:hypothetical protein